MPKALKMSRSRKNIDTSTYSGRFAVRLRMLREKAGLTVDELAEQLKVKPVTIYGWEQGRSVPHIESFPAIAEVFKIKHPRAILPEK